MIYLQGLTPIDIYTYSDWTPSAWMQSNIPIVCGCCDHISSYTSGQCYIDVRVVTEVKNVRVNALETHSCTYVLSKDTPYVDIPLLWNEDPDQWIKCRNSKLHLNLWK